jgi:hypothetical protein
MTIGGITVMIITSIMLVIDLIKRLYRIVTIPITTIMNIFSWYQRDQLTEFPGIYHPPNHYGSLIDIELMKSMGYSWIQSSMAIINASFVLITIIGQPKRLSDGTYNFNVFNTFFQFYADYNHHYQCNPNLPANYCYFGINDGVKNLLAFIKFNPLIASALTSIKDPNNNGQTVAIVIDPYANDTVFGLVTQLLNDDVPRVVAKFTRDLVLQSLVVYQGKRKSTMRPVVSLQDTTSLTAGDKAYLLLNTLVHYAQHIHACIHVRRYGAFFPLLIMHPYYTKYHQCFSYHL